MVKIAWSVLCLGLIYGMERRFPMTRAPSGGEAAHSAKNVLFGVANAGLVALLLFPFISRIFSWSSSLNLGLLEALALPGWAAAGVAFFLMDLWMYAWHRANHRLSWLWRFHRMHHTDPALESTSALRFHTGEVLMSASLRGLLIPLVGFRPEHWLGYELVFQPVILFHHSNIALPERWDRILRALIVSPGMHRIHHSPESAETNSNYASVFSFWDRLFRSFRRRPEGVELKYGLPEFTDLHWQTLRGMWSTPF